MEKMKSPLIEEWLRIAGTMLVDTAMLSKLLGPGFGVNTLESMRSRGVGPSFYKNNGKRSPVIYDLIEVEFWLRRQKRETA